MRTVLILPYFGKFPNYFRLYLETIRLNDAVDWLFFTDDKTEYDFPDNVTVVYKKFDEIQLLFQSKFEFKIFLESPFKLCDFRPSFGYVFEEYLTNYDYWGHCDPDILWGNFNNFLNWDILSKYDKIFTFGHLTLYKNTQEINKLFMSPLNGAERFKTVFTHPKGFAFDEKQNNSINSIFDSHSLPVFQTSYAADIDPYHTNMILSNYNYTANTYTTDLIKEQLFTWENGCVYRYYIEKGKLIKEEFLYIHLQKRQMKCNFTDFNVDKILISFDEFLLLEEVITLQNFTTFYRKKWFNRQFFKVKWNSFKYKLKYKDYFYGAKKNL
ncbi:DUF6625 family protein [Flavobacterium lacus]|uniref:Uncharacterized protein n=1 Tax=Flavobacterium lacus TaxID=1353778 RepID=A0A328WY31_9FLAO|nr:DUF6625 family protein [Flavobacterium lacus]RAR51133.1 hypothetical protein B0I10_101309 [Flavobacterium lacus]